MRQITILAPSGIAAILEEKLRSKYEVKVEVIPDYPKTVCQIMARKNRKWITICSFASDETIKDIITMFEVNFQLRK
jgi:3-keto-L-gulonate-6-phosphate decarboxylase